MTPPSHTYTPASDTREIPWTPCPTCWGQRVIFENANGEGLVPCTCPACLGLGERLAA